MCKKIDPKKINVPNVCFSLVNDEFSKKQKEKYKKQRLERGFDDTELFSLDRTISDFVYPRLKAFIEGIEKNKTTSLDFYDCDITEIENMTEEEKEVYFKKQMKVMYKILDAFELLSNDSDCLENEEKIKEGLELFGKHFQTLWD